MPWIFLKKKSVATIFPDRNTIFKNTFPFYHNSDDLEKIDTLLFQLTLEFGSNPKIVMEATGIYSNPIVAYFSALGYEVFVLNPIMTGNMKSSSVRNRKTDPIDTTRIASAFYNNKLIPYSPSDEVAEKLRFLCRQYDGINATYQELVVRMHTVIDLIYPNFKMMFYTIRGKGALNFLMFFPSPDMVLSASLKDLATSSHASNKSLQWHLIRLL